MSDHRNTEETKWGRNPPLILIALIGFPMIAGFFEVGFSQDIGDLPNVKHIEQEEIDDGSLSFKELFDIGGKLFTVDFSTLDGYGRPNVNSDGI